MVTVRIAILNFNIAPVGKETTFAKNGHFLRKSLNKAPSVFWLLSACSSFILG